MHAFAQTACCRGSIGFQRVASCHDRISPLSPQWHPEGVGCFLFPVECFPFHRCLGVFFLFRVWCFPFPLWWFPLLRCLPSSGLVFSIFMFCLVLCWYVCKTSKKRKTCTTRKQHQLITRLFFFTTFLLSASPFLDCASLIDVRV